MPDSSVPRERTSEKRAADGNPQGGAAVSESDLWLDELMHDASLPSATERLKNDLQIVLDWLGAKTVRDVGTAQDSSGREDLSNTIRSTVLRMKGATRRLSRS